MAGVARLLTLPRGWPRRIRSAAVHAVSLSNFALTTALGWAAQSLNPSLRLRAELERLQQEIQLLREETRIKDSRMQQIEAPKRPPLSSHPTPGDPRAASRTQLVSRPNRPDLPRDPRYHRLLDGASRRRRP